MALVILLFKKGWAKCRENLVANLLTGIVLWVMGGLIIVAFHWYPAFNVVLVEVGERRPNGVWVFLSVDCFFWGTCSLLPAFFTRQNSQREKAGLAGFFSDFLGSEGDGSGCFLSIAGIFLRLFGRYSDHFEQGLG